jgi:IclR family mhp operon transcriptional activator
MVIPTVAKSPGTRVVSRAPGTGQPEVQSLIRGLEILRLLNGEAGLTASEIARKAGLARITAFRFLKTLEAHGYASRDRDRRYSQGPSVLEINNLYARQSRLMEVAAPPMQQMCREIGWPLVLALNNGPRMIILHTTRDETGFWLRLKGPGSQLPVLRSAMGIAYLAHASRAVDRALIRAALSADESPAPEFLREPARLLRLLQSVRQDGIATLRDSWYSESVPLSAIAVPIMKRQNASAALGLTYYRASMTVSEALKAYGAKLKALGAEIGAQL